MPNITFKAAQDPLGNWSVPTDPEEVENDLVEWSLDTMSRSTPSLIETSEALADMGLKRAVDGSYNAQSYRLAHSLAFARVHLLGRRIQHGKKVIAAATLEEIDALPPDILTAYALKAEGAGLLKPKTKEVDPPTE